MERYQNGVECESPRYRGAGSYFFAAIVPYLCREKADYFEAERDIEGEEPSDLDEILGTCTLKNADETELDEIEPLYTDTVQEKDFYLWRRIYPLAEQYERMYPLPRNMADSILMHERDWAEA